MKRKVSILIADKYLKRKLELILSDDVILTGESDADIIFAEEDIPSTAGYVVTVGRGDGYMLRVPFSDEDALAVLPNEGGERRGITLIGSRVFLGDNEIRFTELERCLFMKLYEAGGEFVSRDELFSVFAEGSSESMLNVYIHYLREKLERGGVRVIISSRKHGYKIDEKFFLQEVCDA